MSFDDALQTRFDARLDESHCAVGDTERNAIGLSAHPTVEGDWIGPNRSKRDLEVLASAYAAGRNERNDVRSRNEPRRSWQPIGTKGDSASCRADSSDISAFILADILFSDQGGLLAGAPRTTRKHERKPPASAPTAFELELPRGTLEGALIQRVSKGFDDRDPRHRGNPVHE